MIGINLSVDVRAFSRQLDDFSKRQLPYATARALTAVARKAADAEREVMRQVLDRPRPFTLNGIAVLPARKESPTAWVYIKPIQAAYLAPEILGGKQSLNGRRAILVPKNIKLDAYGNLPRGLLASLKNRPDIFIGKVTFANGETVDGVWQLPPGERKGSQARLTGGRRKGWKLLIRFADPVDVKTRYRFGEATIKTARRLFPAELAAQLRAAMLTAR